jgi:hypothetical protein
MAIDTEIVFESGSKKYRLILPRPVIDQLGLMDGEGNIVPIIHENRMQLEWLAQKILSWFNAIHDNRVLVNRKLNKRKRIAIIVLLLAVLAAIFHTGLASLIHVSAAYISVVAFALGIIAFLQLLKYYALGLAARGEGLSSDQQVVELKELIQKDYLK